MSDPLALAIEVLDAVATGRHQYDRAFGVVQIEMRGDVSTLRERSRKAAQALRSLRIRIRPESKGDTKS